MESQCYAKVFNDFTAGISCRCLQFVNLKSCPERLHPPRDVAAQLMVSPHKEVDEMLKILSIGA
ncbi:hypothetical protein H6F78_14960 [Coleofasciculus sp. FACHB-64]|uniref:hypothetical protein n=1 Tax=Cyanophyceae TaxID=3028117 RepID=UPI0016822ED5|nr:MULTISPECIES: hypothetical protein [unclassified Coleofasciculus]MBD1840482.1 hypothetical protein [Coleofasciculus sp. FACHB-501]MBD2046882.1 hypothetical protein [Coleofasciculus sp. FACHB-64]